jgi:hypothetical protein
MTRFNKRGPKNPKSVVAADGFTASMRRQKPSKSDQGQIIERDGANNAADCRVHASKLHISFEGREDSRRTSVRRAWLLACYGRNHHLVLERKEKEV